MAQAQYPTLEDVIDLDTEISAVFEELAGRLGIRGAAEATGLTFHQLASTYELGVLKSGNTHRVLVDAYQKACKALGIEPANKAVHSRPHMATKEERGKEYARLTDSVRQEVRLFIRGRSTEEAARELGVPGYILHSIYRQQSRQLLKGQRYKHRAYVPKMLLEKIRAARKSGLSDDIPSSDAHVKFSRAGYRAIGNEERNVIRRFLSGGTAQEATGLLGEFGRSYTTNIINNWISPGDKHRYVHGLDYALMAAIVSLRAASGYYEFASSSLNYLTKYLHVDNTPSRSQNVKRHIGAMGSVTTMYRMAAEHFGLPVRYLQRIVSGDVRYIPAWLYVRIIEEAGAASASPEDAFLMPYKESSSDLEQRLRDCSLAAFRQGLAEPLKPVMQYLAQPQQCAFAFLQDLERRSADYAGIMDRLRGYGEILDRNKKVMAANGAPWQQVPYADFAFYFGLRSALPAKPGNRARKAS